MEFLEQLPWIGSVLPLAKTALAFVVAIGVLVTVHEFGHFWVARRLGVKVLRFSVGFGRTLWSVRAGRDRTEYVLAAVPLGGYVKMLDEVEGEVPPGERHRAFNRQPLAVRTAVVLAGPVFNFLFAVVAYWIMYVVGVTGMKPLVGEVEPDSIAAAAGLRPGQEIVRVADREVGAWETVAQRIMAAALERDSLRLTVVGDGGARREIRLDTGALAVDDLTRGRFFSALGFQPARPVVPARIGGIEPESPAAAAGLRAGDLVVAADGEPIEDWAEWVDFVRARPGETIRTRVRREGATVELLLTPETREVGAGGALIGRIGARVHGAEAAFDRFRALERYGPVEAAGRAVVKTADVTVLTLRMLWKMLQLEVSVENLSGPISIAQYAGVSAQVGVSRFLEFLGIVSVSLGILNLLPIPILDGGHLMYYLIELVQRRPVSEEVQFLGQRLGIAMLVGLMGLAFYNDLARLLG